MPCSPLVPSVAIAIDVLELYRVANLHLPHLSIQAFVKTLCDLHGVSQNFLLKCLSAANVYHRLSTIDISTNSSPSHSTLYLTIRLAVHNFVQAALGRNSPNWRLHHACPACTYKLKNEHHLLYSLLFTMDGNDSLKRILRRVLGEDDVPGPSSERTDSRTINDDFYLTREYVDQWANEAFEDLMSTEHRVCFR
jgi:hypothetical protein